MYVRTSQCLEGAVKKMARFLGPEVERLVEDPKVLRKIVEDSSMGSMKKNEHRFIPSVHL